MKLSKYKDSEKRKIMKKVAVVENFMYVLGEVEFEFELHKDKERRYIW